MPMATNASRSNTNHIFRTLCGCVALACAAKAAKCPDGSDGLTKELYEAGDPSMYANVTCIPENEFHSYPGGDVSIDSGLEKLTSVGNFAFWSFNGTLTIKGSFPLLATIGDAAFYNVNNASSVIALVDGLPALAAIKSSAFKLFSGTLTITGSFPLLATIEENAFDQVHNAHSVIQLVDGLLALSRIGEYAFNLFSGTLTITGSFPLLATIEKHAFKQAGNANSLIELEYGLPALTSIGDSAFWSCSGTLAITGSFPLLATIDRQAFMRGGTANSMIELVDGLPALTSIKDSAFNSFSGTLTIKGSFPLLTAIEGRAFDQVSNANSVIELSDGLPALTRIGDYAFNLFSGTLTIKGHFPLLATIEPSAFFRAGTVGSVIELVDGLPALTSIGENAFPSFSGTLTIKGSFPLLATVGGQAFDGASNADSEIELLDGLPSLRSIEKNAFLSFRGTLNIMGSFPLLATIESAAFGGAGNGKSTIAISCSSPDGLTVGEGAFLGFKGWHNTDSQAASCAAKCLDGSDGLTTELYATGDPSKYADVTCIPEHAFSSYAGIVTLATGLSQLTRIGAYAFSEFSGTLTITGRFPLLSTIEPYAFNQVSNANSVIELVEGLPALTRIGKNAFYAFGYEAGSRLAIKGSFPLLTVIGENTFDSVSADSVIELVDGLPALTRIGTNAFNSFSGLLTITGSFPVLATINGDAFRQAGNANSVMEFVDGLPALTRIGTFAFSEFCGTLTIKGSVPLLARIEANTFDRAGNANSVIELFDGLPALTNIGMHAFDSFSGTLTITGRFPLLATIGLAAFSNAGNGDSNIAIYCSSADGLTVGDVAFREFTGRHNINSQDTPCDYKCPDGSDGLTAELYATGDPSKYADVTCIPEYTFSSYNGNVTLDTGLTKLTSIGAYAFWSFSGTLVVKGSFSALATIGKNAFNSVSNVNSAIEFIDGLSSLAKIAESAFNEFSGTLTIKGRFPLLASIEERAFNGVGTADSVIELVDGLPALTSIGGFAFNYFSGTLTIKGKFPLLSSIEECAFRHAGNADSVIELVDGLPALTSIGQSAFLFSAAGTATLTIKGCFPLLAKIGESAFRYEGSISSVIALVDGLPALTSIGQNAFFYFSGTLTLKGSFPLLATIDRQAFMQVGNAKSVVELVNVLPSLTTIGEFAFNYFRGTLTIKGRFPLLTSIEERAFNIAGAAASVIELVDGLPVLTHIGKFAFNYFSGTLTITGRCPLLSTIEHYAFNKVSNTNSVIELVDGLPVLTHIGKFAFNYFSGTLTITGRCPLLSTIEHYAFNKVSNTNSVIELVDGLPALTNIGEFAFNYFSGTLTIKGRFPLLTSIEGSAFNRAGTAASVIELVDGHVPKLARIGDSAFAFFEGALELTGGFASLSTIGSQAFTSAGNSNFIIDIACHGPFGLDVKDSFPNFPDSSIATTLIQYEPLRMGLGLACCPDGSVGLTKELYAGGDPSKYANVTCIPRRAFQYYTGNVLLDTGLEKLKSVEDSAFDSFVGMLKVSGPFPLLATIGERAFYNVNTAMANTFEQFELNEKFLNLTGMNFDLSSLKDTIDTGAQIELVDAPQLSRIKDFAFRDFKGTLVMAGAFPALQEMGDGAFCSAGDVDSKIAIACSSPSGLSVNPNSSFYNFPGARNSTGEKCPCDSVCAPCWVPERPIDEKTCTTTTTTATTTTTRLTTATTTTWVRYGGAIGTTRDADADAKRGAAATAGAIVGTLLLLFAIVAAVWRTRNARSQSINRQFAARVSEQAVDFFVANFAHLLVDAGEPNNLASERAARFLQTAALRTGLPPCKLAKGDTMGTGWYGTRYFATLRPKTTTTTTTTTTTPSSATMSPKEVVAKVCGANYRDQNQSGADLQQKLQRFCVEALLIGSLEHPCILPIVRVEMSLLPFMVITERMQSGSLKDYLRACRPSAKNRRHKLAVEDLLGIGLSVVQACEFLEEKRVVHRALMAQNVLVGSNHTQVKLSGFSSLRDVLHTDEYIKRSDAKDTGLDIRFMAIESFAYNRFSVKSDVWAFGILMWEILTLARKPYGAFNPSEIATEVRAGRRLERVDVCPLVLFEEMTKCWHEVPGSRPSFSELHGTLRLLLLEDADALRASVAAATKVSADALSLLQWDIPVKGWDIVASRISDCSMFQLQSRRQGAHARLALASTNPDEAAVLKTVFCVLQNLKHAHLVPLLGCRSSGGAGSFNIFFDLPCSTSANAVTLAVILHTPFLERRHQNQQQQQQQHDKHRHSESQRKEHPEHVPSSLDDVGYLTLDIGPGGGTLLSSDTETDGNAPLHTTAQGCVNLALQMTLAIEYVHANQIVHGRLSSHSFYSCDVGSTLRLLVGNTLGATNFFSATSTPAAAGAAGASGATAATEVTMPQNLRWLPYDIISGRGEQLATVATDVYSLGVLLWELFAARSDGGMPHSATFPSDADLWNAVCTQHSLPPLHLSPLMAPELILAIYAACTEIDPRSRPWVSGVASLLLDDNPARWEKDRTQLERVQNLGKGEFGQVVKMSTRMFSKGGQKDFVAVKMLSSGNGSAGSSGAGAGGTGSDGYSGYAPGVCGGKHGYSGYNASAVPSVGNSVGGGDGGGGSGSSSIANVAGSVADGDGVKNAAVTLQADFLREVDLMKQFRHPNLVQLLGVSTSTQPFMMILEFLKGGSLDQWLPENGPKLLKPTSAKLVHVLHQVALGMDALGNADIVHRDLAARNCLIDEHLHVKVADYGLSRDVEEDKNYYRIKSERPIPLRWTAPEMVTMLKVSASSDVFSFGVLAFEVFTFGGFPFATIPDDTLFLNFLTGTVNGRRMEVGPELLHRPLMAEMAKVLGKHGVRSGPPAVICTLMQDCLIREPPTARPTFAEIVTRTRFGSAQQYLPPSPGASAIADLPL